MADDQPGPPGGRDRDDRPGERPTEPLGGGTPPPEQPPQQPPPPERPTWPEPPSRPEPPPEPPQQPTWPPPPQPPQQPPEPPPGYGQPPPQQPYGQQYGYGQQPGSGYAAPQTEGTATAALIIAIVGFFICAPVGAIVALVLANNATKRIEASGGRLTGMDQARAARIIAIVELVLTAVVVLIGIIAIIVGVSTSNNTSYLGA
ncbi:MAG TPA: hypothetical protein VFL71_06120 [Actinomycetes bacterium]|nr:hypothetical protein [Actinomycetes bacterium]